MRRTIPPRLRLALALVVGSVAAGVALASADARALGAQCGAPPCWTTFTVDNQAPPPGVALQLTTAGANVMVSLTKSGSNELSPTIGPNSTIHMVLDLGTYDPVVFGTTGTITSFSESLGAANTITVDVKPSASSWSQAGCSVASCGTAQSPVTATTDLSSVVLGFVSDLSTSGATQAVKDAMRGTWLGTNAQSFALPTFNNGVVSFTVAAPHFKTDGVTLNTGFFQSFLPDALVQQLGIADPTTVTNGSFSVTSSNGGSVTFSVSHTNTPAGVLIQAGTDPANGLPTFSYSSPTFSVAKAATAPGAPTGVTATAGNGQATVSFTPPASNGGAAITSYTVTATPGGATASGSGSPITVGNLANGTAYTFTVTATNSAGTSAASAPSSAVTPTAPVVPIVPTTTTTTTTTTTPDAAPTGGGGDSTPAPAPAAVSVTAQSGSSTTASIAADDAATLTLAPPPGGAAAPSVAWGADTFASGVTLTAVTQAVTSGDRPAALSGFAVGSVAVDLTFTGDGGAVHAFAAPLDVVFPGAAAGLAPAYSTDGGATWTAIPELAGTTLSAGQPDGWYRSGDGTVHILTRHATAFGLLAGLVLHAGNRPAFPVGARRAFVYLRPERDAAATITLLDRHGAVLRSFDTTLPAETTRLAIPLPRGLRAGLYLVRVAAHSGPVAADATLHLRLTRRS